METTAIEDLLDSISNENCKGNCVGKRGKVESNQFTFLYLFSFQGIFFFPKEFSFQQREK